MKPAIPSIIKDRPFILQSGLTDRWWLVTRWRDWGNGVREAVEKYPFDDAVKNLLADHEKQS